MVIINDQINCNAIVYTWSVPDISFNISTTEQPVLGGNFSFMCEVTIANDIAETLSYTLIRNEMNQDTLTLEESFIISFQPLTLADAGVYQCSVVISSPYLNNNITMTTHRNELILNFTSMYEVYLIIVIVEIHNIRTKEVSPGTFAL